MLTNLNALKLNTYTANIDTRETRSVDAQLTMGSFSIIWKDGNMKMLISSHDREVNKHKIAEVERIIHRYHDMEPTKFNISGMVDEIDPIVKTLLVLK